jgi:hypothetical protein
MKTTQVTRRLDMPQYTLPEFIWQQASAGLPERMLKGLRRWVILGTMLGEPEARLSRYAGGRG